MDLWYFAYGSNLWKEQMIARTGAIGDPQHPSRIVRLLNHRLVFQSLTRGGPAYANILAPGDGVFGVVYRCSETDLEKLDRYEGGYDRRPVNVTDQQNCVLSAVAYIMKPSLTVTIGTPSAEYLKKILNGAQQHGLPDDYISAIVAQANA